MELLKRICIFMALNFTALAIGGLFTGKGVPSDWYVLANKAPWTPPGWVFGVAWTSIMITFAVYMALLYEVMSSRKQILLLFALQWILNTGWNPLFFYLHNALLGLICILLLTLVISHFLFSYAPQMKFKSLFILPYFIWLLVATSLNAYFVLYN